MHFSALRLTPGQPRPSQRFDLDQIFGFFYTWDHFESFEGHQGMSKAFSHFWIFRTSNEVDLYVQQSQVTCRIQRIWQLWGGWGLDRDRSHIFSRFPDVSKPLNVLAIAALSFSALKWLYMCFVWNKLYTHFVLPYISALHFKTITCTFDFSNKHMDRLDRFLPRDIRSRGQQFPDDTYSFSPSKHWWVWARSFIRVKAIPLNIDFIDTSETFTCWTIFYLGWVLSSFVGFA